VTRVNVMTIIYEIWIAILGDFYDWQLMKKGGCNSD